MEIRLDGRSAVITGGTLDEMIAAIGKNIPLGRMGSAEEFANVACFLASDAASCVAGAATPVDGGGAWGAP